MPYFRYTVSSDYSLGERLDKYIGKIPGGMTRSKLKSGVSEILVNDKKEKLSYKVKAGDKIDIQWEDDIPEVIQAENIPLNIIYEDSHVCVINKEQGMVVHPACGNWEHTLVNALLYHFGWNNIENLHEGSESEKLTRRRPGIVHRLDKDTSGIIITAKDDMSVEFLQKEFHNHRNITKEYICICRGRPQHKQGVIKTQIIRDPKNRKAFRAVLESGQGKTAISHYKCIACYGEYSLMRVRILTGRTHQIRVHMKFINCPILGDPIYYKQDIVFPNATLMLHARMLKIMLPGKKEISVFKTATPERFLKVLKKLKSEYKKTILQ